MKYYLKYIITCLLRIGFLPLRLIPVKQNRVVFIAIEGGGKNEYSCNPMYICEYMNHNKAIDLEFVWLLREPQEYEELRKKSIVLAKHFTLKGMLYAMTARVVVTNGGYISWFPFRKKQFVINTWHGGGAYKRLENDISTSNFATRQRMKFSAKNMDLFLSSCKLFEEYVIRGAFLYKGKVLSQGMPRNDKLVTGDTREGAKRVRTFFSIPEETKIVLYAPTFREQQGDIPAFDFEKIKQALAKRFGGDWVVLHRLHCSGEENTFQLSGISLDASTYSDMQELLGAADVLITDYSSCVWDYSLTMKPCFLYTPDIEEYVKERGFYISVYEWPFPRANDPEFMYRTIQKFDDEVYQRKVNEHHKRLGNSETGHACRAVSELIVQTCIGGK